MNSSNGYFKKYIYLSFIIYSSISLIGVIGNTPKKIFRGEKVEIFDYPYMVSVQCANFHMCGGTIISSSHILTTASCLLLEQNVVLANIEVLTGTNDLQRHDIITSWKVYKVAFVIFHKRYEPSNYWLNDIAILKLESRMVLDHDRVAATVSPSSRTSRLITVGWGINPVTGIISRYLQRLFVESIRDNICQRTFDSTHILHKNQFCIIPKKAEACVTNGAAGSPVMYYRQIAGIVSLISANPKDPVIYTRVRGYSNWITFMMQEI